MIRLFLVLLLLMSTGAPLRAAEGEKALMSETVRSVVKAQEQMEAEAYGAAEATLDSCLKGLENAAYDRAYVQSIYGYLYLNQERYDEALKAFSAAYDAHELTGSASLNMLYNIAQLLAMAQRYDEARSRLTEWMESAPMVRARDYMMLAGIDIRLQHYDDALTAVRQAIARAGRPVQNHYRTLYYLQYELHRPKAAAETLRKMITLFPPSKELYLQLSGLLLQQSDSDGALAVQELAYLQGMLQSRAELMQLAQLYLYAGVPLRAAEVLAAGAKSESVVPDAAWYTLEAQAWQQAREYGQALKAYAEAAAKGDPKAYETMAYLCAAREDHAGVIDAAEKGLAAGAGDPDTLRLLEGQALFEKKEYVLAKKVFDAVSAKGKRGKEARQWLDYLETHSVK